MREVTRILFVLTFLVVFACDKNDKSQAMPPTPVPVRGLAEVAEAPVPAPAPADAGMAALPPISGTPAGVLPLATALESKAPQGKANKKVKALGANARTAARAGDLKGAIVIYKELLQIHPAHVMARYNLSCAYNRSSSIVEGLQLLQEFRELGCDECIGRLVRARVDSDWESAWQDPRFIAITKDAQVAELDMGTMEVGIAKAIAAGDLALLKPYIRAGHPVKAYYVDAYCEDAVGVGCHKPTLLPNLATVATWIENYTGTWIADNKDLSYSEDYVSCIENCCKARSFGTESEMCEDCTSSLQFCFETDIRGVHSLATVRAESF